MTANIVFFMIDLFNCENIHSTNSGFGVVAKNVMIFVPISTDNSLTADRIICIVHIKRYDTSTIPNQLRNCLFSTLLN